MKKCFKLLFLSVLIFSLTSNVFAATAQLLINKEHIYQNSLHI